MAPEINFQGMAVGFQRLASNAATAGSARKEHGTCNDLLLNIVTARRSSCKSCGQACPKGARACFFAEAAGKRLFGFEMRQANLLRWYRAN